MPDYHHPYLPNTSKHKASMLAKLGVKNVEALFEDIPSKYRYQGPLNIPDGLSENEVYDQVMARLRRNLNPNRITSFLGGGVWPHIIPEALRAIISRTEFLTAYTPYQAETSQGMLQTLFEYQSLIAELVDLPVVNSSMYDWASGLGEAALMTGRVTKRPTFLIPELMSPSRKAVLETYAQPAGMKVEIVSYDSVSGRTDLEQLKEQVNDKTAGVYIENPAYLGMLEPEVDAIAQITHDRGAQFVVGIDPVSLGVIRPPGNYGADIVVGEGQPLGMGVNFGGPLLGLFACQDDRHLLRQLPGRIIGLTTTEGGERQGFVMTLQAREQHIRRERATSNICSNQALCAVTAAVYLCLMGPKGIQRLGEQIMQNRQYAEKMLSNINGVRVPHFQGPHFKEFVISLESRSGHKNAHLSIQSVLNKMRERDVLGGIPLVQMFPQLGEAALLCVTEVHSKKDIDRLAAAVQHALEVA